jgi:hypothetical protein
VIDADAPPRCAFFLPLPLFLLHTVSKGSYFSRHFQTLRRKFPVISLEVVRIFVSLQREIKTMMPMG